MTTCHHCGAPIVREARHGPLLVRSDPPEAFWRGKRLPLRAGEAGILFQLASGRASHLALEMLCTREDTLTKSIAARISMLRRKLRDHGVGLTIEAVYGWGYRFGEPDGGAPLALHNNNPHGVDAHGISR
jgi:DNA-binding response OmpR family regulator